MIGVLHYPAPLALVDRLLLVMLPGAGIRPEEFSENGLVDSLHAHGLATGLAIDAVAVRPELELYLDGEIVPALHRAVIEPARARGYARIWLLGISLGGMGALRYASAHAGVEGLLLLAPFLGTRGTIAELAKAGGLAAWSPDRSIATRQEQLHLLWLQKLLESRPATPALYLGYGLADRFAPGSRLLHDLLPEDRVVTAAGGHEWACWKRLFEGLLERSPFAVAAARR